MSILILQLPARPRHNVLAPGSDNTTLVAGSSDKLQADHHRLRAREEYAYVLTHDGFTLYRQGTSMARAFPGAESVVAVIPAQDVSWHRINCPKAPASRMQAALVGLLEENLLEDPGQVHLALAPQAQAGAETWVAACDRHWLAQHLTHLEKEGVRVNRIVPAVWPDEAPAGYFFNQPGSSAELTKNERIYLTWSTRDGVATWPIQGSGARDLLPAPIPASARFFAAPAAAAPAERWLGASVEVQSIGEHLLQASKSLWNLRQFDMVLTSRGLSALEDHWHRFIGPGWKPVRWGLMSIFLVHVLGLNLWAWEQREAINDKRFAMQDLMRTTHPHVSAVHDAPAQMLRENQLLRAAAGQAGAGDLESLLQVAASAWPTGLPVQSLQYDGDALTISITEWQATQIEQFRTDIEAAGWLVEVTASQLVIRGAPQS